MMMWGQFVLLVSFALLAASLPIEENSDSRMKRSPVAGRMMVSRGYMYDRPANSYDPQPQRKQQQQQLPQEEEEEEVASDGNDAPAYGPPAAQPEEDPQEEQPRAAETPAKRRSSKEEKSSKRRRTQGPSYSNFFPMMFANPGASGRNAGEGGQNPAGGSTAIANSFSTGKRAIASSHATAYGSAPPASQSRQDSPSRYRA